jgi:hypothetical protein
VAQPQSMERGEPRDPKAPPQRQEGAGSLREQGERRTQMSGRVRSPHALRLEENGRPPPGADTSLRRIRGGRDWGGDRERGEVGTDPRPPLQTRIRDTAETT